MLYGKVWPRKAQDSNPTTLQKPTGVIKIYLKKMLVQITERLEENIRLIQMTNLKINNNHSSDEQKLPQNDQIDKMEMSIPND